MKKPSNLFLIGALLTAIPMSRLGAQEPGAAVSEPKMVERVQVLDGQLTALADGKPFVPTNVVTMPLGITVMTNLTFTVGEGKPRKLEEGQVLGKDGMLQSPNGSLVPVIDHVTQMNGKVMIQKDGVRTVVSGTVRLSDGSTVMADGTYVDRTGRRTRLLDGQIIRIDGTTLPATDTATLKSGQVILQKDGSLITLRPTQSMMMSDGTKVSGDGTVTSRQGEVHKMAEGEVVKIEGVRRQ